MEMLRDDSMCSFYVRVFFCDYKLQQTSPSFFYVSNNILKSPETILISFDLLFHLPKSGGKKILQGKIFFGTFFVKV